MTIIICPECKKKVSDKADRCLNCGYPLKRADKTSLYDVIYVSQGTASNVQSKMALDKVLKDIDPNCDTIMPTYDILRNRKRNDIATCISITKAVQYKKIFEEVGAIVDIRKSSPESVKRHNEVHNPTCPKCGSTSITTSARGVNWFWGFLGASSTVNRCANCGHAWYPETGKSI